MGSQLVGKGRHFFKCQIMDYVSETDKIDGALDIGLLLSDKLASLAIKLRAFYMLHPPHPSLRKLALRRGFS